MSLKFDEKFKISDLEPVQASNTDKVFKGEILDSSKPYYDSNDTIASLCKILAQRFGGLNDVSVSGFTRNAGFDDLAIYKKENDTIAIKPSFVFKELDTDIDKTLVFNDIHKPYLANRQLTARILDKKNKLQLYGSLFDYVDGMNYLDYMKQNPTTKDAVGNKIIDILIDLKSIKANKNDMLNEYYDGTKMFKAYMGYLKQLWDSSNQGLKQVLAKVSVREQDKKYLDFYKSLKKPNFKDSDFALSYSVRTNPYLIYIQGNGDVILQEPALTTYSLPGWMFNEISYHIDFSDESIKKFFNSCNETELKHLYAIIYIQYTGNLRWYLEQMSVDEKDRIDPSTMKEQMPKIYNILNLLNEHIKEKENIKPKTK